MAFTANCELRTVNRQAPDEAMPLSFLQFPNFQIPEFPNSQNPFIPFLPPFVPKIPPPVPLSCQALAPALPSQQLKKQAPDFFCQAHLCKAHNSGKKFEADLCEAHNSGKKFEADLCEAHNSGKKFEAHVCEAHNSGKKFEAHVCKPAKGAFLAKRNVFLTKTIEL